MADKNEIDLLLNVKATGEEKISKVSGEVTKSAKDIKKATDDSTRAHDKELKVIEQKIEATEKLIVAQNKLTATQKGKLAAAQRSIGTANESVSKYKNTDKGRHRIAQGKVKVLRGKEAVRSLTDLGAMGRTNKSLEASLLAEQAALVKLNERINLGKKEFHKRSETDQVKKTAEIRCQAEKASHAQCFRWSGQISKK